jgi:hypothetical protein
VSPPAPLTVRRLRGGGERRDPQTATV